MPKITVMLADDHPVVRQGLRALLQRETDIEIVGEADTGRQAVRLARNLKPDVVVMDIAMARLNGLEATRQINKETPSSRVLILSSYSDDEYLHRSMEVGAAGYLLKQAVLTDVIRAIREVKRGYTFFGPTIAKRLVDHYRETLVRGVTVRKRTDLLTSREVEVLQLVAEGQGNKQIAADLGISVKTVERHRQSLMNKLNIHDVAGLTRYALSQGIIKPSVSEQKIP